MKLIAIAIALLPAFTFAAGSGVPGTWNMTADAPDGQIYKFVLIVKDDGGKLSAALNSTQAGTVPVNDVAFSGGDLTFKYPHPSAGAVAFKLHLDGDSLKGSFATPAGDTGTVAGTRAVSESSGATGKWKVVSRTTDGRERRVTFELKQEGTKLAGQVVTENGDSVTITEGEVNGDQLKFKIPVDEGVYSITGTINGNEVKGSYTGPGGESGTYTATKA